MRTWSVVLLLCGISLSSTAQAGDIQVPGDFPTIQMAIDSAMDGDVIVVAPGTYPENLTFLGKAITVVSSGGPEITIVDGGLSGSVVRFENNEGPDSVIEGFTLTGGSGTVDSVSGIRRGCGIYCVEASPTIRSNWIVDNVAVPGEYTIGGGIFLYLSSPLIQDNVIAGNAAINGAGMDMYFSFPQILDNVIAENESVTGGGAGILAVIGSAPLIRGNMITGNVALVFGGGIMFYDIKPTNSPRVENNYIADNMTLSQDPEFGLGGGIFCQGMSPVLTGNIFTGNSALHGAAMMCAVQSQAVLTNNTFWGNTAEIDGGAFSSVDCDPMVTNCIFWGNEAPVDPEIHLTGGMPFVSNCIVQGGTGASILDLDPEFVDPDAGDFHLSITSPAIDVGDDGAPELPDNDFEGDPRIVNGTVDLGVDEVACVPFCDPQFVRGDANADSSVGLPDAVYVLNFIFVPGSPAVTCLDTADLDDSGTLNLADPVSLLVYLFVPGNPAPADPFPACGTDPTPDTLDCDAFAPCP